ncbi:MAG: enoyl-CoA hydratase [Deltaproteobacteria bacterium SG8_13]|nr:MAG: enoyl-CoA hydratase [Deltaproteobacteria bacterium SG8_13]
MAYQQIQFETEGSIGTLTLNNPSRINALSTVMISEITAVLTSVATDESIAVIIVKAAGKHFCAGHDLAEMTGRSVKANKHIFDQCTNMMRLLHQLPQPVITQVQGIATAAGCQLVAWSDLAVAEEGARFSTPGVRIGLFCTTPGAALSRAIGRKAALEMLLTGRYVSAREAQQLGLINRVVPLPDLDGEVYRLASDIAQASRYVLALGKQGFYAQVDQTDRAAFDYATNMIALNLGAEDAQIGIRSFLEKKDPAWVNR